MHSSVKPERVDERREPCGSSADFGGGVERCARTERSLAGSFGHCVHTGRDLTGATSDIGDIVFTLVDMGLLVSQPNDSRDDFDA